MPSIKQLATQFLNIVSLTRFVAVIFIIYVCVCQSIPQQATTVWHHPNSLHFFGMVLKLQSVGGNLIFTLFTLMSPSGSPGFTLGIFQSQPFKNMISNFRTLTSHFIYTFFKILKLQSVCYILCTATTNTNTTDSCVLSFNFKGDMLIIIKLSSVTR